MGSPDSSVGKESACNAGDLGSIPGLGRSPGEGKGYPFQYSGLENSMGYIVHGVPKSQTRLSDFHFHFHFTFTSIEIEYFLQWLMKTIKFSIIRRDLVTASKTTITRLSLDLIIYCVNKEVHMVFSQKFFSITNLCGFKTLFG